MELWGANLSRARLTGADLTGASLAGANLRGADLIHANLSSAVLSWANLSSAVLIKAILIEAKLYGATLVETDLTDADLTGCHVYGISAWNLDLERTKQQNLVITAGGPTVTVDNIEVAQFIYLLLGNEKIRDDVVDVRRFAEQLRLGAPTRSRISSVERLIEVLEDEIVRPAEAKFNDWLNFNSTARGYVSSRS